MPSCRKQIKVKSILVDEKQVSQLIFVKNAYEILVVAIGNVELDTDVDNQ